MRWHAAGLEAYANMRSPSEPSRTDPVQGQGGRGASPLGGALLAQSDVVPRTDAPRDSPSLANSSEEGSTFSERGHPLAHAPRLVESPRMVLGRDAEVLSGLPPAVVNTITSARALSTRQAYRLKWNLSLKTVLLSALATVKRVGDLKAFSVDDSCLEFGPADSHVVLRPRPGYVPKVPTMPFRDQVVNLQALPREEADPAIALLCPVRALRIYVDRTQSFRTSDQLFVCFGGQQKGRAVSKQRLRHSPLRTGYVRPVASQFSSPRRTLLKFLPHPRQSGVAEHQTPGPVLVRCPRSTLVLG